MSLLSKLGKKANPLFVWMFLFELREQNLNCLGTRRLRPVKKWEFYCFSEKFLFLACWGASGQPERYGGWVWEKSALNMYVLWLSAKENHPQIFLVPCSYDSIPVFFFYECSCFMYFFSFLILLSPDKLIHTSPFYFRFFLMILYQAAAQTWSQRIQCFCWVWAIYACQSSCRRCMRLIWACHF